MNRIVITSIEYFIVKTFLEIEYNSLNAANVQFPNIPNILVPKNLDLLYKVPRA